MSLPSPVATDNMPILEDNVPKYNIDQTLSMYIPYVSASAEYIKETIEDFGFGKVKRVDCVSRGNDEPSSMAFIHMEYWEEDALTENFQERIKNSEKEARIVYDDPNYWIILPNKNPLSDEMHKMQVEIDYLKKENEELKDTCKNLRWFVNLHDANIEYLCKEIQKIKDEKNTIRKYNSSEDSDNYIEDEHDDNVVIRKNKRIRSTIDNTCGAKTNAWKPDNPTKNNTNIWCSRLRPRINGTVLKSEMYSEC